MELTKEQKLEADNLELHLLLSQCRFQLIELKEPKESPLILDIEYVLGKKRKRYE